MFHHISPVLSVILICNTPMYFSPCHVVISPSPATPKSKRAKLQLCHDQSPLQSPHHTSFPIQSGGLFTNMYRSSLVDPGSSGICVAPPSCPFVVPAGCCLLHHLCCWQACRASLFWVIVVFPPPLLPLPTAVIRKTLCHRTSCHKQT